MRSRPAASVLVLIACVAGCGGGEEDEVRDAMASIAAAGERRDGNSVCVRLTTGTRELIERAGRLRTGEDPRCADLVAQRGGGDPGASLNEYADAGDDADVTIEGDRARVRDERWPITLLREDGQWRVDLASVPEVGYPLRASVACGEIRARDLARPLPAASRAALARDFRAGAASVTETRRALARLRPPRERLADHRTLLTELRREAASLRRIATGVDGVAGPLEAFERQGKARVASERRLTAAQRRLDVGCLAPVTSEATRRYREQAERICGRAARGFARLERQPDPGDRASALRYLGRVVRTGERPLRALRGLEPPGVAAKAHRTALGAYEDAVAELRAQARLAREGRDPTSRQLDLELASLRSTLAFNRLALRTCASL